MLRKPYLIIFCIFLFLKVSAQPLKIIDKDFDFKSYPKINFSFWTRSVQMLHTTSLGFYENERKVSEFTLSASPTIDSKNHSANKVLLVLIENHYLAKGIKERAFFKQLLSIALLGNIKAGDKIYIATFDWYRSGKYTFIQNTTASDNESQILNLINNINAAEPLPNRQIGSDIYFALDEALDFLEKVKDTLPQNILLLSDDYPNIASQKTVEEVTSKSIKLDIPIYAIGYNVGADRYSQITKNEICARTNGLYFSDTENDAIQCGEKAREFIENMNASSAGKMYTVYYNSFQKRVGQAVNIKVEKNNKIIVEGTTEYPFNLFDWVITNIIKTIGLFLAIILLIFLFYKGYKKRKKKKIEKIIAAQEKELQMRNSENEIEKLKAQQAEAELRIEKQKKDFDDNIRLEKMGRLLKAKGITLRINYEYQEQKGQFYVDSPLFTIGRNAHSNSFHMNVPSVSANHAKIEFFENGQYYIEDLKSTNGILLNDTKVERAILKNNDIVKLGDVTLKINL